MKSADNTVVKLSYKISNLSDRLSNTLPESRFFGNVFASLLFSSICSGVTFGG
jgi:hypothetical protein